MPNLPKLWLTRHATSGQTVSWHDLLHTFCLDQEKKVRESCGRFFKLGHHCIISQVPILSTPDISNIVTTSHPKGCRHIKIVYVCNVALNKISQTFGIGLCKLHLASGPVHLRVHPEDLTTLLVRVLQAHHQNGRRFTDSTVACQRRHEDIPDIHSLGL